MDDYSSLDLGDQLTDQDSDSDSDGIESGDESAEHLDVNNESIRTLPTLEEENKLSFKLGEDYNSPVYIQRYLTVADILAAPIPGTETKIKRVVDIGCAELNFFKYLKNLPNLSEISFVDIDTSILESACVRTRPLAYDYLHKRKKQLTVRVFAGSVADEDERIQGVDAVTCIELIEHLNDDVLQMMPSVIFGFIQPKLVAITTPNVEFNVLFPDSTGFRHWDHKFEWTRLQFRKWCLSVVDKYPQYAFTVSGIGEGPAGSEHLGCCTQMAVFINTNIRKKAEVQSQCTPYNLISEYIYPSKRRNQSLTEEIVLSAEYYIHMLGKYIIDNEAEGNENEVQLSLKKILEFPQMLKYGYDENQLGILLSEKGWEISDHNGLPSLLYTYPEEEDSEEEEGDKGDGDTELSGIFETVAISSEMNAYGDGLEDWDIS